MIPVNAKAMPAGQRLAVHRAEYEARLSALEGGARFDLHHQQLKWLAAEIWAIEHNKGADDDR